MTTEIEARYRVVTPLFSAGADPQRAELRAPSFKGVLRFWWRALAWPRLNGELAAIQREEDALFGSASDGQSRVSTQLIPESEPTVLAAGKVLEVGDGIVGEGACYLGYGVMEAFGRKAGQLTRSCLSAPLEFTARLRGRSLREGQVQSLQEALIVLGSLGGMGAKSRKGYGSLVLRSLRTDDQEQWHAPESTSDLHATLKHPTRCRVGAPIRWADFTAVSQKTRILTVTDNNRSAPLDMLNLVGHEMMRYRSWGYNGNVLGEKSEHNFRDDHDLMKSQQRNCHPRRVAFGLPHNYGKRLRDKVEPFDRALDRRASPLFIHIHECGHAPVAVLSFLPARFLPVGRSDLSVGGTKVQQAPEVQLYGPVHDFLDRLLDDRKRREPFASVTEIRP
ncbi:MAG: type III-B CRISPR module RAMP protein Cmr1 [Gammaproteobacteria bacterium]|nr:type III-B CRISPR module RAMP protein Cmr1 [Gammaproteobacteria bacterium]